MCKIPGGYILLARKTLESDIMGWPPHYLKIWVWMLGKANWRDRDKLRRGQLVTTIAEMQKECGYKIGYRTRNLTKDEVRSAYEAFMKATMITTAKTTRGMIITICNYDKYQNHENYEDHNEHHSEDIAHPTGTPHDTEEGERKKNKTLSSSGDEVDEKYYLSKKGKRLSGKRLESFERFWSAFDYKQGKAEAADAWMSIPMLTDAIVDRIVAAASVERARRPDILRQNKTPKMAQGWLSGRRWEDEEPAVQDEPVPAMRGVI